ncbi:DUF4974 domain-containing protein [Sphingobacterium sp. DK4209]|uniref:DUF4974 domain-containing protein n=1 Tax=Sphingobacterium zhuxiongii TaxID=2662364 RepID=A0A5Q0QDV3_9SPHI|nr:MULTISPECIES: FecR family protein [unclassified Sphingobacterium]MVZ64781.1 DUF4974 domain-containing protein [Sphingobacterium sp. DK4209]QGA27111.1 DUF4974 domain-containing protein [Sphingobacterium sp. dk4302]
MKLSAEIAALIKKHLEGNLSELETNTLKNWLSEDPTHQHFFNDLIHKDELYEDALAYLELKSEGNDDWLQSLKTQTLEKIETKKSNTPRRLYRWVAYAASVLVISALSYYFLVPKLKEQQQYEQLQVSDVKPGSNKAELRLSNGQIIQLRSDKDGITFDEQLNYQDGTNIIKLKEAELAKLTATIEVPQGGKYQVSLPDGTIVFLNSASRLTYPLRFAANKRVVTLEGEGYFEVKSQHYQGKKTAFIVNCQDQQIEVTGTQFNVNAYPDEQYIKTTLVEGSVNVIHGQEKSALKPNQQLTWNHQQASIQTVDVATFIAWKDNKFLFNETELREVMRNIARWYDIQIAFEGSIPATYFYGEIERNKNLSEVLSLLEKSGIKFQLDNKNRKAKLTVLP